MHADEKPPRQKRMNTKKRNELTAPAPKVVALHRMQESPRRILRFMEPERMPAYTPKVEYEILKANEETRP